MIMYKELSWRYWAVTAILLIVGLAGQFQAFYLATALSAVQIVHFRFREGSFAAFPVQVPRRTPPFCCWPSGHH